MINHQQDYTPPPGGFSFSNVVFVDKGDKIAFIVRCDDIRDSEKVVWHPEMLRDDYTHRFQGCRYNQRTRTYTILYDRIPLPFNNTDGDMRQDD